MDTPAMQDSPQELDLLRAVARRMKLARLKEGLTHAELAERIKVNKAYVFELERGSANPTLKTLHRVATALRIDPAELLPGSVRPQLQAADLGMLSQLCESVESLLSERRKRQEDVLKMELDAVKMLRGALEGLRPLEQPSSNESAPGATDWDSKSEERERRG